MGTEASVLGTLPDLGLSLPMAVHLHPSSCGVSQFGFARWFLVIAFGLLMVVQNPEPAKCPSWGFPSGST